MFGQLVFALMATTSADSFKWGGLCGTGIFLDPTGPKPRGDVPIWLKNKIKFYFEIVPDYLILKIESVSARAAAKVSKKDVMTMVLIINDAYFE